MAKKSTSKRGNPRVSQGTKSLQMPKSLRGPKPLQNSKATHGKAHRSKPTTQERNHRSASTEITTKPPRSKENPKLPPIPQGVEILYGKHSVKAVLLKRPQDVQRLLLAGKESYHDELVALARKSRTETFLLGWPEFKQAGRFSDDDSHQGVMAYVKPREIFDESAFHRFESARCVLVLDQVSNPQNLATIIRSAAFFHVDAVCTMKNRAAAPTPEVARFAVGGSEMVDLYQITNVASAIESLKDLGFTVLGLDERGRGTLAEHDLSGKVAFVVGAEGEGLRQKTKVLLLGPCTHSRWHGRC